MPRSRPVDYPQVHPPTAQSYAGLAPPLNVFADPSRFSWQDSSTNAVSPSHAAEQQLEAGNSYKSQEHRQSKVPPLPTLPDYLNESKVQEDLYESSTEKPADHLGASQQDNRFNYYPQVPTTQELSQPALHPRASQFRPDIPRHFQVQQQPEQAVQPSGPPLSYEASQAQLTSQSSLHTKPNMYGQLAYPDHYDGSGTHMTAHALPINAAYQPTTARPVEPEAEERVFDHPNQSPSTDRARQQGVHLVNHSRPLPIHIGPDVNPLLSTSPTTASPSQRTRFQKLPSPRFNPTATGVAADDDDNTPPTSFPQATSYTPPGAIRGGTWHNSLSSCSNPTICLPSIFCPCVVYGRTQHRLSQKSAKKDPTNMLGYSTINGSCIAWSILCGVNILLTAIQHTRVRKTYEMEEGSGNVSGDFVKSICCCCCVIAQDEKEVKIREEGGSKEGVAERGYKSPGAMMYSPPPR